MRACTWSGAIIQKKTAMEDRKPPDAPTSVTSTALPSPSNPVKHRKKRQKPGTETEVPDVLSPQQNVAVVHETDPQKRSKEDDLSPSPNARGGGGVHRKKRKGHVKDRRPDAPLVQGEGQEDDAAVAGTVGSPLEKSAGLPSKYQDHSGTDRYWRYQLQ